MRPWLSGATLSGPPQLEHRAAPPESRYFAVGQPDATVTASAVILALYGLLERMTWNPMVTLNRAIAAAMVHGPATGLSLLSGLDTSLAGHHRLDAVRAHLLEMAGDNETAIENYRLAASRTTSLAERQYLTAKAAALGGVKRR